jgi:hypothetical protein
MARAAPRAARAVRSRQPRVQDAGRAFSFAACGSTTIRKPHVSEKSIGTVTDHDPPDRP